MEKTDPQFLEHSPTARQWKNIGVKQHHGFVIPLFSLHTKQSCGIGEYLDLIPIIEWCALLGYDTIQLLPLNDTGLEISPYSALSAFALNPIHISLAALPSINENEELIEAFKAVPKPQHASKIHYPVVREGKNNFLKLYYQTVGNQLIDTEDYKEFIKKAGWLKEYTLYKTLKSSNQWKSWQEWPEELQNPTQELIDNLVTQHKEEIEWHAFMQYLCHIQLRQVANHAIKQHVFLMGDIPILIDRDSADVWYHRNLFNMNFSAGAPPDMYSSEGQNWGFPIYNWDKMSENNYRWWIERLKVASQYYQLYRIDHIVGFFRIWSIPHGLKSIEGHFNPSNPEVWIDHGQKILMAMIENCNMLPIGEDLGTIPPLVRTCLCALGICGTRVIRWEREWDSTRKFIPMNDYSIASMTTVSTHDSETIQLWWQNNPQDAKEYAEFKGWFYHPTLSRSYHQEILWDSHHSSSLFHINLLSEYLALIPGLTWPSLEEERVNVPGVYSQNNWSYRFKPTVEEMIENTSLNHILKELIL